jgi:hypothetical protein
VSCLIFQSWLPEKHARHRKVFLLCYCALSVIVLLGFFFLAPSINKSALCVYSYEIRIIIRNS